MAYHRLGKSRPVVFSDLPDACPRSQYGFALLVTHPQRSVVQHPVADVQMLTISDTPEIAARQISSTLVRKEGRLVPVFGGNPPQHSCPVTHCPIREAPCDLNLFRHWHVLK